jgi:cytoskeletal protein CcmA (bactofilin family)
VVVNGPVGKDARLGGGTVSINGPVGGELLMGGGTLEVGRDAVVGGDAYLAGGQITVSGAILGGVRLAGQEVYLNGPIGGNVVVRAQKLSIGPRAVIAGDLKYQAAAPAQISSGAQVRGATNFTKISAPARYSWGRTLAMLGLTWLFKLLAAVAAVLVIFFLFPSLSAKFAVRSTTDFWRELARGLVILIVAPILVLILFASVVGAGVALILLAAYILFIIVAWVMSAFTMAGVLSKYVFRRGLSIDWQILVLSVAVIFVLGLIPVLGWLIAAAFFLVAFGTLCKIQFTELRS